VEELVERCAETPSPEARFAYVGRWLMDRLAHAKSPDLAIAWMAAEIERSGGALRVGSLQRETSLSRTRVTERFREQIGTRPKQYARLVRFRHVLERLQDDAPGLAGVAPQAGWHRQAPNNAGV